MTQGGDSRCYTSFWHCWSVFLWSSCSKVHPVSSSHTLEQAIWGRGRAGLRKQEMFHILNIFQWWKHLYLQTFFWSSLFPGASTRVRWEHLKKATQPQVYLSDSVEILPHHVEHHWQGTVCLKVEQQTCGVELLRLVLVPCTAVAGPWRQCSPAQMPHAEEEAG